MNSLRKEIISHLSHLVSFKTVNPPGNEYKASEYLEHFFRKNGIRRIQKFEKKRGRTNLIAKIGSGKPELSIVFHSDVVPEGGKWKKNPFKLYVENGKAYGRGTVDNKGAMTAGMLAFRDISHSEKFHGTISFVAAADEEKGSIYGIRYLLAEKKLKPNFAIVPDLCGNLKTIGVAEKDTLWMKITFQGKQGHAAMPENFLNPSDIIRKFHEELTKYQEKLKKQERKEIFRTKTTLPITNIRVGNGTPNIIAGFGSVIIDARVLPSTTSKKVQLDITKIARKLGKAKIEMLVSDPGFIIDHKKSILYKKYAKAVSSTAKIKPRPIGIGGRTITAYFVQAGVESISCGCGDEKFAHAVDENIRLDQIEKFYRVLMKFFEERI